MNDWTITVFCCVIPVLSSCVSTLPMRICSSSSSGISSRWSRKSIMSSRSNGSTLSLLIIKSPWIWLPQSHSVLSRLLTKKAVFRRYHNCDEINRSFIYPDTMAHSAAAFWHCSAHAKLDIWHLLTRNAQTVTAFISFNRNTQSSDQFKFYFMLQGTDQTLLNKLHAQHGNNSNYLKPRSDLNASFGINHFAGIVFYETKGFLEKNRDTFSGDLIQLVQSSQNKFLRSLFKEEINMSIETRRKYVVVFLHSYCFLCLSWIHKYITYIVSQSIF